MKWASILLGCTSLFSLDSCGGDQCGRGTKERNGTCEPTSQLKCGLGTEEQGGQCVPVNLTCGAGTRIEGSLCVWDNGIATQTPWRTNVLVDSALGAESSIAVDSLGNAFVAWISIDL